MKRKTTHNHIYNALQSKSGRFKGEGKGDLPRKKKHASKATIKGNAWRWFSKYIRLRDCLKTTGTLTNARCITCGKLLTIGFCDAGHFVSRRHNSTFFDETNVHTQCRYCNRYLNGNLLEYRRQIIKMYGEGYDTQLETKAVEIIKYTEQDLISIGKQYKMKIENLQCIAKGG